MKPKKDDLAAGRLGKPSDARTHKALPGSRSDYGSDRLGIVSLEMKPADIDVLPPCPCVPQAGTDADADITPLRQSDLLNLEPDALSEEFFLPHAQTIPDQIFPDQTQPGKPEPSRAFEPNQISQSRQGLRPTSAATQTQWQCSASDMQMRLGEPAVKAGANRPRKIIWISSAAGLCVLVIGILIARSGQSQGPALVVAAPTKSVVTATPSLPTARVAASTMPARPKVVARARIAPVTVEPVPESPLAKVTIPASQMASSGVVVEQALGTAAISSSPRISPTATSYAAPAPNSLTYRDVPAGFTLGGIINCPDGAYASINNHLTKAGGMVNGARVIQVRDFSVEMELEGRRFILAIGADSTPPSQNDESSAEEEQAPKSSEKAKAASDTKPADADDSNQQTPKPSKKKRSTP